MTVFQEIVDKVNTLDNNGIEPSILIIGEEKMALLGAEEPYMKNWLITDYMTITIYQYKLNIFVDNKNKRDISVYGNSRLFKTSF